MKRNLVVIVVLSIGLALLLTVAGYAQKGEENKPYAEGAAAASTGSYVAPNSPDRTEEGFAGRTGRLEGVSNVESKLSPTDATLTIYRFSGATDDGEQGSASRREATSIHCTNIDPINNVEVEVQVFQWNGTDVYTGTVNMPPNRTFTFSTQNTTIYFDDVILGGSPGTPAIFQGSGRILGSSRSVVCTAQALDPLNYPPIFVTSLELFK